MNFRDRPQWKKGRTGELILLRLMIKNGIIPYEPFPEIDTSHPFDFLCVKQADRTIFIMDAKSKPARLYYPDTGINIRNFEEYDAVSKRHNAEVFLSFVDEKQRKIYGNWLHILSLPKAIIWRREVLEYPWRHKGIIYFPLESMQPLADLNDEEVAALERHSTRQEAYEELYALRGNSPWLPF